MTDKQFYITRNLLSWIIVALFIIVAGIYMNVMKTDPTRLVGKLSIVVAVVFFIGICVRMFFFTDKDRKEPLRMDQVTNEKVGGNNDTLNVDGSMK